MTDGAHRARSRRILSFAARQLVQIWWYELVLPRVGFSCVAERTRERRMRRLAERVRSRTSNPRLDDLAQRANPRV